MKEINLPLNASDDEIKENLRLCNKEELQQQIKTLQTAVTAAKLSQRILKLVEEVLQEKLVESLN